MAKRIGSLLAGITDVRGWECGDGLDLTGQLDERRLAYSVLQVPTIVGMGGNARVVSYTSSQPVTVLVVPWADIDTYGEDYYYLEGMTAEQAAQVDWVAVYDVARDLK